MRDPVQHLLNDHIEIMAQVARLRAAVADLEAHGDEALDRTRPALASVASMMATQLLAHARKEDEALFPAVEAVLGEGAGPTPVMREEHREIHAEAARFRATLRELNEVEHPAIVAGGESLGRLVAGRASAAELARTGAEVARLLDQHFEKEEQVLFPMCRELLSPRECEAIGRRMEEIEAESAYGG
jgi:iron-sulfur cluster repair protein YtfE (RIC family)